MYAFYKEPEGSGLKKRGLFRRVVGYFTMWQYSGKPGHNLRRLYIRSRQLVYCLYYCAVHLWPWLHHKEGSCKPGLPRSSDQLIVTSNALVQASGHLAGVSPSQLLRACIYLIAGQDKRVHLKGECHSAGSVCGSSRAKRATPLQRRWISCAPARCCRRTLRRRWLPGSAATHTAHDVRVSVCRIVALDE